ncbi:hypothetical protein MFUL124B02_14490 [Myxococcus fulvus 124B02]|nr:hypothetical protein MFUL124B02_14490 [Myxococcus fulvus 124B02]
MSVEGVQANETSLEPVDTARIPVGMEGFSLSLAGGFASWPLTRKPEGSGPSPVGVPSPCTANWNFCSPLAGMVLRSATSLPVMVLSGATLDQMSP